MHYACHMLKLVRNTFGDKKIILSDNGKIEWRSIESLQVLQEKERLRLANTLTALQVQFRYQKIKERLAAQLQSSSVADARDLCEKEEFKAFSECQETVTFLRNFNKYFEMLTRKVCDNMVDKAPKPQKLSARFKRLCNI